MGSFAFFFSNNAMTSFFIYEMFFNQQIFLSSYRVIKINTVIINKENQQFKCDFWDAVFKKRQIKHKHQPWELEKKCDSNFILTFAVAKVRYDGITTAKIFIKNVLFLVFYQQCNNAL